MRSTTRSKTLSIWADEQQVAAVLGLVDREAVAEPGARLLVEVEPEAQAGGVDPLITRLVSCPIVAGCDKVSAIWASAAGSGCG